MPISLRLSILENRPERIDRLLDTLRRADFDCAWQRADNEPDFLAQLDTLPQIILASYDLHDLSVQRALQILQERAIRIPLIAIGDMVGEEAAVACLKQDAADYLNADHLARLGEAVRQALARAGPDHSAIHRTEAALEIEDVYRAIFNASLDALIVTDALGRITFASSGTLRLFGLDSAQAVQGQSVLEWIAPIDRERATANIRLALANLPRLNSEYTLLRKDGSTFIGEINSAPFYDDAGNVRGLVGFTRDITERKNAEEALRASEEKYRTLFDQSKEALLISTPDGQIRAFNQAHLELFGYPLRCAPCSGMSRKICLARRPTSFSIPTIGPWCANRTTSSLKIPVFPR